MDFISFFAHFIVPIRCLDELSNDAIVRIDAVGESRDLFKRREDALGMLILSVRQEFNIIGFDRDRESRLFNKVLVNCVEPPHKELCSLRGIIELGVAVLVGLIEVCCCTFDWQPEFRFLRDDLLNKLQDFNQDTIYGANLVP